MPTQQQSEALYRAKSNLVMSNYPAILEGFAEKGIRPEDIEPRVNVFTFAAWKALKRQVRKGEHGVRITVWITCQKKQADQVEGEPDAYRRPKKTTVFHVSQTDPMEVTA